MQRFRSFAYQASKNHTRTCWVLKCDIRKFFASIDHQILFDILAAYIPDDRIQALIVEVVRSFRSEHTSCLSHPTGRVKQEPDACSPRPAIGLPLGNLTSQLLVNAYMNEFDQFAKHKLKAKYYLRYADDFVFLSPSRPGLDDMLPRIGCFLSGRLHLALHSDKMSIATFASGVDFLGWVHFPSWRVLRTATKRRMFRRLSETKKEAVVGSYLGLLSHGNAWRLKQQIHVDIERSA